MNLTPQAAPFLTFIFLVASVVKYTGWSVPITCFSHPFSLSMSILHAELLTLYIRYPILLTWKVWDSPEFIYTLWRWLSYSCWLAFTIQTGWEIALECSETTSQPVILFHLTHGWEIFGSPPFYGSILEIPYSTAQVCSILHPLASCQPFAKYATSAPDLPWL